MKQVINKIFNSFNLRVTKGFKIYRLQKNNVFNTNYREKVLLSYITEPFASGLNYKHTQLYECITAAEVFHKKGFSANVYGCSLDKKK